MLRTRSATMKDAVPFISVALCATLVVTAQAPACGEGELSVEDTEELFVSRKIYGANRRVTTKPLGYAAVQGTFTIPEIFVPVRNSAQFPNVLTNFAETSPMF